MMASSEATGMPPLLLEGVKKMVNVLIAEVKVTGLCGFGGCTGVEAIDDAACQHSHWLYV